MLQHVLRLDATDREQARMGCHLHAMTALRVAIAQGSEWIRVEKPGHACDFMVAALREHVNQHRATMPHCIINVPLAEQRRLGTTVDSFTRRWPGGVAALVVTKET